MWAWGIDRVAAVLLSNSGEFSVPDGSPIVTEQWGEPVLGPTSANKPRPLVQLTLYNVHCLKSGRIGHLPVKRRGISITVQVVTPEQPAKTQLLRLAGPPGPEEQDWI